jgi:hypothetical protein
MASFGFRRDAPDPEASSGLRLRLSVWVCFDPGVRPEVPPRSNVWVR